MKKIKQYNESREIPHLPISWEEKGIKKGIEKGKREVALEMLKEGASIGFIVKVTQLSRETIKKLRKTL